ncbi:MAG TPA: hypothetical protein VE974_29515 [Thermoanaerobaculia bacterium]|nr:hypothetical protein [Thermoanaerobaculia bacterium]
MNENIKDTVKEKVSGLAGGAFEKQKGTALGELDSVASALRKAGSELGDSSGMAGKLVSAIADRVESAGQSLDGKELGDVVDDLERFARRNPATFISGAIAVGFIVSRFLKSSSSAVPAGPQQSLADTGMSDADFPTEMQTLSDDGRGEGIMDRPLIAGVAALAVGAIVGTIIRETDREHELFGQHRERLTTRAMEAARQTVARGVAEAASTIANRGGSSESGGGGSTSGNGKTDVGQNIGV